MTTIISNMSTNTSSIYDDYDETSFNKSIIIDPLLATFYIYQTTKLYEKYKTKLDPVEILELNCLADRCFILVITSIFHLDYLFPKDSWVCFLFNYLMIISLLSFTADFSAIQVQVSRFKMLKNLHDALRLTPSYLPTLMKSIHKE